MRDSPFYKHTHTHTETALGLDCMHAWDGNSILGCADLFGDVIEHSQRQPCVPCCLLPAVIDVHHLGDAQIIRLFVYLSDVAALAQAVNADLQNQEESLQCLNQTGEKN